MQRVLTAEEVKNRNETRKTILNGIFHGLIASMILGGVFIAWGYFFTNDGIYPFFTSGR